MNKYIYKDWKYYKTIETLQEIDSNDILTAIELMNVGASYKPTTLELEMTNFKINSSKWKKKKWVLTSPEWDIWEDENGEQFFTWDSAMRETQKIGKRIPTDKEFNEIVGDISKDEFKKKYNIKYVGSRYTDGSTFSHCGNSTNLWSSSTSGAEAYFRYLLRSTTGVYRYLYDKAYGFSVRTILEK